MVAAARQIGFARDGVPHLPLLTESGLVREMDFGRDHKFYDPNYADHPNHSHIICQECNTIVEFDSDQIKKLEGRCAGSWGSQ
jgi:Fe2+ or Zn2+ uptake regulation protein